MRFLLVLLCCSSILSAQITDDFSDGDFTINPAWEGDVVEWTINDGQLQSNGPAVSGTTIHLSTTYVFDSSAPTEWTFFVNPKVATSSNNFMQIYLLANSADLQNANSVVVRVGDTDDEIALYNLEGGEETLLIDGDDDVLSSSSNNPFNVKVVYDDGLWKLFTDAGATGLFSEVGQANATTNISGNTHFGISATYSQSNAAKYFFDNLYIGEVFLDDTAPELISAVPTSSNELLLTFSEPITEASALAENFSIPGLGIPLVEYDISNPSEVALFFIDELFPEGVTITVTASNIQDFAGNVQNNATSNFTFNTTGAFAILITEIFPDPEPSVALPIEEFIEIHNTTSESISLLNWTFSDASSDQSFGNFSIDAGAYAIVCNEDHVGLFEAFGQTIPLGSLPSLNNSGDQLSIRNAEGKIIHQVAYSSSWYQNPLKESGGWTLEMIDVTNPCGAANNWIASNDSNGGTPGQPNSVTGSNPDTTAPEAIRVLYQNQSNITVEFSEAFPPGSVPSSDQFSIPGIDGPLVVSANPDNLNQVDILLPTQIEQGNTYEITVGGDIADCSNNTLGTSTTLPFGVPQEPIPLDIILNEILFNPRTGSVDFVELYNQSDKILDLRNLRIANAELNAPDVLDNTSIISFDSNILYPKKYMVLSESAEKVLAEYETEDPTAFLDISDMPSYNDDEGIVVLVALNGVEIDRVHYNQDWHHPLIDDEDGVSLERIDFGLPSDDRNSWQSAASAVGYATPGYRNSNFFDTTNNTQSFQVEPPSFSPDGDGFDDFNFLQYNLDRDGFSASVKIFNDRGLLMKTLANNEILGASGTIKWDGSLENGEKATIGKYIWLIDLFHPDGEIISEKIVVTLAGFLD